MGYAQGLNKNEAPGNFPGLVYKRCVAYYFMKPLMRSINPPPPFFCC